jgi:hypothetical protein
MIILMNCQAILANPKKQQVTKGMTIALQETQDKRSSPDGKADEIVNPPK